MSFNLDDLGTPSRAGNAPHRTPVYDSPDQIPNTPGKPTIEEVRAMNAAEEAANAAQEEEVMRRPLRTSAPNADNRTMGNVREVSPFDIAPHEETANFTAMAEDQLFGPLDRAVEREKDKITELQNDLMAQGIKELEDDEANAAIEGASDVQAHDDTVDTHAPVIEDNRTKVLKVRGSAATEDEPQYGAIQQDPQPTFKNMPAKENAVVEPVQDSQESEPVKEEQNEDDGNTNVVISKSFEDDLQSEAGISNIADAEDDEDEDNTEDKSMTQRSIDDMKAVVKKRMSPITKKFDLSKFSVAKTAKSVNDILKKITTDIKTSNWVCPNAGTVEVYTPLSAMDIMNLDPSNHNKTKFNTFRAIYKTIYDHVVTPNKPDFEKWLRTTLFHDVDHIYFGLYLATFGDSAFVSPVCEKKSQRNKKANGCGYQFIAEHKPMDYVKFKTEESRKKFDEIMRSETYSNDNYDVTLVQISDNYAFGLRMPSVYNVVFESASLSDDFTSKYNQLLEVFSYIDDIYFIDSDTQTLVPVKYEVDKTSQPKTTINKIRAYQEIYKRLSADEQSALLKNIRDIENEHDIGMSYIMPAHTCPECGEKIEEEAVSPLYLLFTRHQLGHIQSM